MRKVGDLPARLAHCKLRAISALPILQLPAFGGAEIPGRGLRLGRQAPRQWQPEPQWPAGLLLGTGPLADAWAAMCHCRRAQSE
jgi:hypothetical protein